MRRLIGRTALLCLMLSLLAWMPAGCGSQPFPAPEMTPSPAPDPTAPPPSASVAADACTNCAESTGTCAGCAEGSGTCTNCAEGTGTCAGCAEGSGTCAGCTPEAAACAGCAAAPDTTLSAFLTADFSGAGTCTLCHDGLSDEAGADVSLAAAWRSTMMANAARDPFWQASVSAEVARMPALQPVIEGKCVSCHMPMAEAQAEVGGQPAAAQEAGFFDPAHPLHEAAFDGVSCTLCHQIEDAALGTPESFSGGYTIDTSTEPPNRAVYGPYEEPFARPMQMHTGFVPVHGAQTGQAELCATCHNLYTPYVDEQGQVLGEFPEQTPSTEWQNSSFGGTMPCQACHMPQAEGGVVISTMPRSLAPREPFFEHWFVGGNALLLGILRDAAGDLEVTADAAHFEATRARL